MITAEELEKLAELKKKGIITEDEFNAKRDEFLGQNYKTDNSKNKEKNKDGKKKIIKIIAGLILFGAAVSYFTGGHKISTSGNMGKNGFNISISCTFNGAALPLQSCTGKSEVVITSGADRRSYNSYNMPSSYSVPEHFDFYIYNGSDKFTINMVVKDNASGTVIAHRQVGPYDGDRIGN